MKIRVVFASAGMHRNPLRVLRHCFVLSLLSISLVACNTVGPTYQLPQQAVIQRADAARPFIEVKKAKENIYQQIPLPAHWWRLYRTPALDQLIEKAFAANTDVRIAAANLLRVRAIQDETEAATQPVFGVNAAPGVGRSSAAAKGLKAALPNGTVHEAGVSVAYQFDLVGKLARAIEASDADTQAAQAAYDLVRVTIAADTARAYADICSSRHQMQVAQKSIDLQQQFLGLTEQRLQAGRGTTLDTSLARAQLAQLRSVVPPLQAQNHAAQYRLAVLTGELPGALSADVIGCDTMPRLTSALPVGDGAALLRRRPDIRQAERGLAAATAHIGIVTAELYPSISFGFSAGSTGTLPQFGATNAFHWNLGPLLSWTVPSTGTARSHIAQAEAATQAALARFDGVVLNSLREAETALTVYSHESARHAELMEAKKQNVIAAEQAHTLFQYGRTDFLNALEADRMLAAAESALAVSEAQLATDQINLFMSLGGGWETGDDVLVHASNSQ
ncbi:efflux transporter outer membrane subunit [Undibacterium sp. SXout7W]|uniref:efflux transporter outer membrane subunit n=1 Tax=Undibacterium sp. SXout7W TaxID=3413049 RepID=UPI003BF247B6